MSGPTSAVGAPCPQDRDALGTLSLRPSLPQGRSWCGPGSWGEGKAVQQTHAARPGNSGDSSPHVPGHVPSHRVLCGSRCSGPAAERCCLSEATEEGEPGGRGWGARSGHPLPGDLLALGLLEGSGLIHLQSLRVKARWLCELCTVCVWPVGPGGSVMDRKHLS